MYSPSKMPWRRPALDFKGRVGVAKVSKLKSICGNRDLGRVGIEANRRRSGSSASAGWAIIYQSDLLIHLSLSDVMVARGVMSDKHQGFFLRPLLDSGCKGLIARESH